MIVAFISQGTSTVLFPAVSVRIFGMRAGGRLTSISIQGAPYAALTAALIVYVGGDRISTLHVYSIIAVLTSINLVVLYNFKEEKLWAKKEVIIGEKVVVFDEAEDMGDII